jgi:hypothetical protein
MATEGVEMDLQGELCIQCCEYSHGTIECLFKVTGQNLSELRNKISECNKLSRAIEMPSLRYRNKNTLFSHRPPHVCLLDRIVRLVLSSGIQ